MANVWMRYFQNSDVKKKLLGMHTKSTNQKSKEWKIQREAPAHRFPLVQISHPVDLQTPSSVVDARVPENKLN